MARGRAELKFEGRLFQPTLTRDVVGILNEEVERIADETSADAAKKFRKNRGLGTGRLKASLGDGKLVRDLRAEVPTRQDVERYMYRVEYGTPAYGTKGQNQLKNARKNALRQLRPEKIGGRIVDRLNSR